VRRWGRRDFNFWVGEDPDKDEGGDWRLKKKGGIILAIGGKGERSGFGKNFDQHGRGNLRARPKDLHKVS